MVMKKRKAGYDERSQKQGEIREEKRGLERGG
jgi:hypothetical protein